MTKYDVAMFSRDDRSRDTYDFEGTDRFSEMEIKHSLLSDSMKLKSIIIAIYLAVAMCMTELVDH